MNAATKPIEHVSDTALWVAYHRAQESNRPDALFNDPYAAVLAGDRGRAIAESMKRTAKYTAWTLAIRTRIIDDMILALAAENADAVLNLGAGLDARPYRMALPPALKWIEADYAHVIEEKEMRLAAARPRCRLQRVRIDLADREARRSLFSRVAAESQNVLVLTEGVLPYLEIDHVAALAADIHAQPNIRHWIAEYHSPKIYRHLKNSKEMKKGMSSAPFRFFPDDWFGLFAQLGWIPRETKYLGEESIRLKRTIPAPWFVPIIKVFMSRKAVKQFERFSAYVLLRRQG